MALVLTDAVLATMCGGYGLVGDGAVVLEADRIAWVGQRTDIPVFYQSLEQHSCGGRLITPGLVDCHSHAIWAGSRAGEFEARLNGASYEQIARAGGGILSTVVATRASDEPALIAATLPRIDQMIEAGTTTIEVKSGYGLTIADEIRMLLAARAIPRHRPVHVVTTHLAAHALPPEYRGQAADYIAEVAIPSLRAAHAEGLVDQVDAFCEGIAFSTQDLAPLFAEARTLGLPVKLHAEQLSDRKGAVFAAAHGALSCDHVEYIGPDGVAAMAAAGTVAVLLPGAFYTLRETQAPPVAAFRAAGVAMAVATDLNPGTSPMTSLPLAMNMACTLFGLTPEEALLGATAHAARALGLSDRGRIAPGLRADLCIWEAGHPAEIAYRIGGPKLHARIFGGRLDA
jgi:imidazolonepropionase